MVNINISIKPENEITKYIIVYSLNNNVKVISGIFASGNMTQDKALILYFSLLNLKKKTSICFTGLNKKELSEYLKYSWLRQELNKYQYQIASDCEASFFDIVKKKYNVQFDEKINRLIEHKNFIEIGE